MHPDGGPKPADVGAYVMCGGASARMGQPKHRLEWRGRSVISHLVAMATPHATGVWLVGKAGMGLESHGIPVLIDRDPDRALVHGMRTALAAPGPPWRWLLACDMPAVDATVLHALWRAARAAEALGSAPVRALDEPFEPLPSLWHTDALRRVADATVGAARDLVERAGLAPWLVPFERHACLANLNTPGEWDAWRKYDDGRPD